MFGEDGIYDSEDAYILPGDRKIQEPKNYDFEVDFTFDEIRDAVGQRNEFYVRFLDQDGNIVGEDYFYFVPYGSSAP